MSFKFVDLLIKVKSLVANSILATIGINSAALSWFSINSIEHKLHYVTGIYAPMLRLADEVIH